MHEMEESVRSGGILKKKSTSGCLIIKKKGDGLGSGVGSSHQEKKRPRVLMSDSGSSGDSLEHVRRKVKENMRNAPVVYSRRSEEEREMRRNSEFMDSEKKRSRFDLYDFDEYDEFDGKRMRNDYTQMVSGSAREFGGGSRNVMVEKRKQAYFDSSSGSVSRRKKAVDRGGKNRSDLDEDEAHLPVSLLSLKYQEDSAEPIRLQGKNGVLKVMVKKKKNMELPSRKTYDRQEHENRKGSRSEDIFKKDTSVPPSFYSDSKRAEKLIAPVEREKSHLKLPKKSLGKSKKAADSGLEKSELKIQKPLLGKSIKSEAYDSDGSDTALKLAPPSLEAGSSRKGVKLEAKQSLTPENGAPIKGREKKVVSPAENVTPLKGVDGKLKQRSGSTEKQLLRERIREMLMKAGWTIDYRPRRNRDYLDAVYINPSGTAYWSIIKAYDALQKQLLEDDEGKLDGISSSFAPLADDLINKLTRQTRKKIEEEMKRKRKNDGPAKNSKKPSVKELTDDTDSDRNDERLSSFIRQNGKPKKGRSHESKCDREDDSSDNPEQEGRPQKPSTATSSVVQGRKSRKIGRCTLLIRGSEKGHNSEPDGYVPYTGKRTLLSWLIDSGTVQLSEKVQYMNRRRTRVKLEGWITKDGIHCGCCSKILPVLKFELHAGSKLRQPFQNILLESGPSLLQCLIDAWNKQEESARRDFYVVDVDGDDPDDDTCGICGDGGDLICCDGCPSTFHLNCLGIEVLPPGDWHCPNCTCKFCGTTIGSPTDENGATSSELSLCLLCEKKYHKSCSDGMDSLNTNANNSSIAFCGRKCQELYDYLQKILGVKHELESGFSWSLLQRTDLESDTTSKGFPQRVESNSKLAVALSVMDECFLPIVDRRSRINLIHNVLYNSGSNFNRLNFRGFFTMILERGDEIISAASIRIRGPQLAEMPFIGTRNIYRRQGMCRRLLSAIESVLSSLKVEKLIIPAISEHMHTWTVIFGFKQLQFSDKKGMKSMNILVFPGTDLLQKQLLEQENPDVMKGSYSRDNLPQSPASMEKADTESPSKQHGKIACGIESECNDEDRAAVPVSSASPTLLNDGTVDSALDSALVAGIQLSRENASDDSQLDKDTRESSGSPAAVANDPPEIESTILDSSAKCDTPTSADNLMADAHKMDMEVSPSSSILDLPGKSSNDMVADVDVDDDDQDPVSTDSCVDKNSMPNQNDQDAALVEISKICHVPAEEVLEPDDTNSSGNDCDGAVSEGVLSREIFSANGVEKDCTKQNLALDFSHCCNGDPIIQLNTNVNEPAIIAPKDDSHVSSKTLGDAKVSAINRDTGTDVKALLSESTPDFIEASSRNGTKEVGKQDASSDSGSQSSDHEVTPVEASLSSKDKSGMENGLPIASLSGSAAEVALLNEEVNSSSESENTHEDNAASMVMDNPSSSAKRCAELDSTSDGNSEHSGQLSCELNDQKTVLVEAGNIEETETTQSEVTRSETVAQPERATNVALSSCVSMVPNGTDSDK